MNRDIKWDFFIAHAGPDIGFAKMLYDDLALRSRVFLDSHCLKLGDDWDVELAKAQKNSEITVVLVSERTDAAYYQREEIAAAIALARKDNESHRVVPVYLASGKDVEDSVPYGLRLKHGITLGKRVALSDATAQLLELLRGIRDRDASAFLYGNYIIQLTSPNLTDRARQQLVDAIERLPGLPKLWPASVSGDVDVNEVFDLMKKVSPINGTNERKALWLGLSQRTLENELKRKDQSGILPKCAEQFEAALKDLEAPEELVSEILAKIENAMLDDAPEGIEDDIVPKIFTWLKDRSRSA